MRYRSGASLLRLLGGHPGDHPAACIFTAKDRNELLFLRRALFTGRCLGGRILPSSGQVIPEVSDGSFLIGITLEETARKAMDQYEDISMLYPEDGTSAVPDGCAMVKNAPHSYNAGKFIDFVVSYDTQRYATENFYRRSARRDVGSNRGNTETFIKFDVEKSAREEEEVFSLWNALAGQEGE